MCIVGLYSSENLIGYETHLYTCLSELVEVMILKIRSHQPQPAISSNLVRRLESPPSPDCALGIFKL